MAIAVTSVPVLARKSRRLIALRRVLEFMVEGAQ
jgi:hypothetical protein